MHVKKVTALALTACLTVPSAFPAVPAMAAPATVKTEAVYNIPVEPLQQVRDGAYARIRWRGSRGYQYFVICTNAKGKKTTYRIPAGTYTKEVHVGNNAKAVLQVKGVRKKKTYYSSKQTIYTGAPSVKKVSAVKKGKTIRVSWKKSTGATEYWVKRSVNGKTPAWFKVTKSTSFIDKKVRKGNTYRYSIFAKRKAGSTLISSNPSSWVGVRF